jgi:hypothetical protein
MKRFLSVLGMKILQPTFVPRTQKAGVKGSMNQQGTLSSNPDYDSENGDTYGIFLHLDNDNFYDSDFSYMIPLVRYSEEESRGDVEKHIQSCHISYRENHTPDVIDRELDSLPDLLHLNDFRIKAKVTCQHITDRYGRKFREINANLDHDLA